MIVDGSIHKSGFPIVFEPVLIKPIKDKHILTPFELKIKALFKKMLAKKNKGKKKKTKNKGGGKSKYNIKMTRKFRRTRRKRGSGPGGDEPVRKTKEEICRENKKILAELNEFNAKDSIEKINKAKADLDAILYTIENFDGNDSSTWVISKQETQDGTGGAGGSGGGHWSDDASDAHQVLLVSRDNTQKKYNDLLSEFRSSLIKFGIHVRNRWLLDVDKIQNEITLAKTKLEAKTANCDSNGGKKSRRKRRRRTKKRKSRRRKKRSRRRIRKKR